MSEANDQPLFRWAAALLITAVVIAGLYYGQEFLIPITLALFVSLLLVPVVRWVERLRLGRLASVGIVVLASMGLLGATGWLLVAEASALTRELPGYRENIERKYSRLRDSVATKLGRATRFADTVMGQINDAGKRQPTSGTAETTSTGAAVPTTLEADPSATSNPTTPIAQPVSPRSAENAPPVKVEVVASHENPLAIVSRIIPPVTHPIITLGFATVILIFFLLYREDLRDRLIRLCGRAHIPITTATLSDTEARVARYVAAQAMANAIMGVVTAVGLYAIGVPRAPLWGLLSAILRFIPFIGPIIAALFPMTLAASIFDGWLQPALVLAWIILVDLLCANFLDPWLCGSRVGASPTALLLSFVFWSGLWGAIGLLLATPITVCLIVLGKHVPGFEIFYILLSNEQVLEPNLRFYQRILSQDRREAVAGVKRFAENELLIDTYDTLLLPALAELQSDFTDGLIFRERIEFARTIVKELIEWLSEKDREDGGPNATPAEGHKSLMLLPGNGAFDDLLPEFLFQLAPADEHSWKIIPPAALASEIVDEARASAPESIIFVAIEPPDIGRIRHICKRLALARDTTPIHVALFSPSDRGQMHRRRLRRAPGIHVWATLSELLAALRLDVRPASDQTAIPRALSA